MTQLADTEDEGVCPACKSEDIITRFLNATNWRCGDRKLSRLLVTNGCRVCGESTPYRVFASQHIDNMSDADKAAFLKMEDKEKA